MKELKPKALANPSYLVRERYELLRGSQVVPITRATIDAIGRDVRMRQKPGPGNALGRVKFVMPNPQAIYLHDTPSRGLFARARRDFSHGCIRVAEPAALAAWALRDLPEWTPAAIDSAMTGDRQILVPLPRTIPVYVVYQSVVVRESGEALLYPDIYGHDRTLDGALRKGYPFPGTALASLP
ncbi:MAG: L,D-transpeptidase family protein [Phycisphaerales bacterium]